MRRVLLVFTLVLLFSAVNAFADCKKCDVEWFTGCKVCSDTSFDAFVLCEISNNGNSCIAQGECNGPGGPECPHQPCPMIRYVSLPSHTSKLQGDWQLVSVEVLRVVTKEGKPGA